MEEEYGTCDIRCQPKRWSWEDNFNSEFGCSTCRSWQKSIELLIVTLKEMRRSGLGVQKGELEQDVYDVLVNQVPMADVIVPTTRENLMIAPSTIQLAGAEIELTSQPRREQRLKEAVKKIKDDYDYIFIDCPPSLGHFDNECFYGQRHSSYPCAM